MPVSTEYHGASAGAPGNGPKPPQVSTEYQKQAFQNHGYDLSRPTLQGATWWGITAGGGEPVFGCSGYREIRAPQASGNPLVLWRVRLDVARVRRLVTPNARSCRPPLDASSFREKRRAASIGASCGSARWTAPYWRRGPAHFLCGESGATL